MQSDRPAIERRVLLLTPTQRDAEACCSVLSDGGMECFCCSDLPALCTEIKKGAAVVILPEEVVIADLDSQLDCILQQQHVWSDLPIIVLSNAGAESASATRVLTHLRNVSLLERPMRITTLISVIKTALRARERQYQVRDHLAARESNERSVREARDGAERANRLKDQFLAALSHELRTPLTPALMAIASLDGNPALPQQLHEDVAMIRRNINLEARLIDDLLDLSRITTSKLSLQLQPVDLHQILRDVFEICRNDLESKRLELCHDFSARSCWAVVDPTRIQQVFWNIIKNSVKFTPPAGRISVRTWDTAAGGIAIEISDTGIGIDEELMPRVFNAFEQGDRAIVHQFGGLGLGLAISKSLIDMQGGTISVSSEGYNAGTTFTIEFPSSLNGIEQSRPVHVPAKEPDARLSRVLLVEDNPDTVRVMARVLTTMGHQVRTADCVSSALEMAKVEQFDVLISDLGLPDASGYELMREMRNRYGTRGIALSGYGMEDDMRKSREAGFMDHLVKPIDFDQLQQVISRVTDAPVVDNCRSRAS
jgi:signal transduction histidine kinase/ActR/RegA family two-component response regulator